MYVYLYIVLRFKPFLSDTCIINSSFLRLRIYSFAVCRADSMLLYCCSYLWCVHLSLSWSCGLSCHYFETVPLDSLDIFTPAVWSLWKSVSCLNPKHMKTWTKLHIAKKICHFFAEQKSSATLFQCVSRRLLGVSISVLSEFIVCVCVFLCGSEGVAVYL